MTTTTPVDRGVEKPRTDEEIIDSIGAYQYGWHDTDVYGADVERGLLKNSFAISRRHDELRDA